MSKSFTLDDIRAAAEREYADTTVTLPDPEREGGFVVTLVNPLRLPKNKRDAVTELQERMESGGDDVDQEALMREVLSVVCAKPIQAERLNAALTDLTQLAIVFKRYSEETEVGEA